MASYNPFRDSWRVGTGGGASTRSNQLPPMVEPGDSRVVSVSPASPVSAPEPQHHWWSGIAETFARGFNATRGQVGAGFTAPFRSAPSLFGVGPTPREAGGYQSPVYKALTESKPYELNGLDYSILAFGQSFLPTKAIFAGVEAANRANGAAPNASLTQLDAARQTHPLEIAVGEVAGGLANLYLLGKAGVGTAGARGAEKIVSPSARVPYEYMLPWQRAALKAGALSSLFATQTALDESLRQIQTGNFDARLMVTRPLEAGALGATIGGLTFGRSLPTRVGGAFAGTSIYGVLHDLLTKTPITSNEVISIATSSAVNALFEAIAGGTKNYGMRVRYQERWEPLKQLGQTSKELAVARMGESGVPPDVANLYYETFSSMDAFRVGLREAIAQDKSLVKLVPDELLRQPPGEQVRWVGSMMDSLERGSSMREAIVQANVKYLPASALPSSAAEQPFRSNVPIQQAETPQTGPVNETVIQPGQESAPQPSAQAEPNASLSARLAAEQAVLQSDIPGTNAALVKFVKSIGGIHPTKGAIGLDSEIARLAKKESGVSGLVRPSGGTIDHVFEAVAETGQYPDLRGPQDLVAALEGGLAKITEEKALQLKQRQERGTYKQGYAQGSADTRAALIQDLRQKKFAIDDVRQRIINYARALPLEERGKLLPMVKNSRTEQDLRKAFSRIDQRVEKSEVKRLVNELARAGKRISRSNQIGPEFRKLIENIFRQFDFTRTTAKRMNAARETRAFIDRMIEQGHLLDAQPRKMIEDLSLLTRKTITQLRPNELQAILDEVQMLERTATMKFKNREARFKEESGIIIQQLLDAPITKMESKEKQVLLPGETPSIPTSIKNKVAGWRNWSHINILAFNNMDVLFDILDGSPGTFQGAVHRTLKASTDVKYMEYLAYKEQLSKWMTDLPVSAQITDEQARRVKVHAIRVQPGGMDVLRKAGYTDEQINSVVLTEPEMTFYKAARKFLNEIHPELYRALWDNYGIDIGFRPDYWPGYSSRHDPADNEEIWRRLGDLHGPTVQSTKNIPSIAKRRGTLNFQDGNIGSALYDMNKYVDDVAYAITMAPHLRRLAGAVKDERVQEKLGDIGTYMVREWVDLLARKGGSDQTDFDRFMNGLRNNTGVAVMGYKLSTAIVQFTSLIDATAVVGPAHMVRSMFEMSGLGEGGAWARKFVLDSMPEIRNRIGDDPALYEYTGSGRFMWVKEAGFRPLKAIDRWVAMATAYGAFKQEMEKQGYAFDIAEGGNLVTSAPAKVVQEAIRVAQLKTRVTQASPFFKDTPLVMKGGKHFLFHSRGANRTALQFQNFTINQFSTLYHLAVRSGFQSEYSNAETRLRAMWILAVLLASVIGTVTSRRGSKRSVQALSAFFSGKPIEQEKNTFLADSLFELSSRVPFVGNTASAIAYETGVFPLESTVQTGYSGLSRLIRAKSGEARARAINDAVFGGFLPLLGVPGSAQFRQVIRAGFPVNTGPSTHSTSPSSSFYNYYGNRR